MAIACLAALPSSATSDASSDVEVRVIAREIAPGELLRVVVEAPFPIASVTGSIGKEGLSFLPEGPDGAGHHRSAWGVIDLDAKPGPREVRIDVTSSDGAKKHATSRVSVIAKKFPQQKLSVEPKYVEPSKEAQARIEEEKRLLGAIYARRSAVPPPSEPFVAPVTGEPTSQFGARRVFNGKPRAPHSGLDLQAATGTPVLAASSGEVAYAGDLYFSGNTVILDHGGGLFTVYAHLSRIDVQVGGRAARGEPLGLSGATGRVTGPHLHWGAKLGETIFDPRALLDPRLFSSRAP